MAGTPPTMRHGARFALFGPDGTYRRTILPRPSDLPLDRVRSLGEVVLDGGEHFPLRLLPQYGGSINQSPVVAPDGDLIFANGSMRYHAERYRFICADRMNPKWPRRLLRLAADGGAPDEGVLGPVLGKFFEGRTLYLALARDGRTVYVSGARNAVFKVRWGKDERPVSFVGTPDEAKQGESCLKNPCGISLDPDGNLYVADRGNHRIVRFNPAGEQTGELKIEWPRQVAVHPKTGVLYVICGYRSYKLLKFAGIRAETPTAERALASRNPTLALDVRGSETGLYVGNVSHRDADSGIRKTAVIRLRDAGEDFGDPIVVTAYAADWPLKPLLAGVDRTRELVYAKVHGRGYMRWNGRTGARQGVPMRQHPKSNNASEMTCGAHGTIVFHVAGELGRFNHKIDPVPFASSGSYIARLVRADGVVHSRDVFVAPSGTIYRIHERGGQNRPMRISTVKPDGTAGRDSIVVLDTRSAAGIRVDREGNIYILDHVKPLDQPVPPDLEGKVKVVRHSPFVYHYGSVLKFRPEGGEIDQKSKTVPIDRDLEPGQKQFTTAEGRGDFVADGLLWSWYGASMVPPALDRGAYHPYNCVCVAPRFDIDEFARVFVPDQLRCRIVVLDTDGKVITSFGRYGNADERSGGIRLADPRSVMVSHGTAYVGDPRNNRIVRVGLEYRDRAACRVEWVEGAETLPLSPRIKKLRARMTALRAEVENVSPTLAAELDWSRLAGLVNRRTQSLTMDDVRAELAVFAPRAAPDWPEKEADALLGRYLASHSARLRNAVAWGLSGGRLGTTGRALLVRALKDKDEMVRMAAAYVLLDRDDPAGLAQVFRGTLSDNPNVYKLAETSMLRKLLVWDSSHPLARTLDLRVALVPVYEMDHEAVVALGEVLDKSKAWYLRRSALFLLGFSGRPEAAPPLVRAARHERDKNLNRCLSGLGRLRYRKAVPDLLKYLERGHGPKWGTPHYNGDRADFYAARSLVQIADPESVGPIIRLLDSEKPEVRKRARRALTDLFAENVSADRCLVPTDDGFARIRIDELPEPAALRKSWQAFWKANRSKYEWPEGGPPLRPGS